MATANEMSWSGSTRAPAREAKHKERVDKVRDVLLELKSDMELRRYMLDVVRDRGQHCRTCSPSRKAGACGPTCPLTRPDKYQYTSLIMDHASETWRRESLDTLRRYKTITDDLQRHGYSVSVSELNEWEKEAKDMHWREIGKLAERQFNYLPPARITLN